MKHLLAFFTLFISTSSIAQTDEEMLEWLNKNITAINLEESERQRKNYKLESIKFTKDGIECKGDNHTDYVFRSLFASAEIEDDFLNIKSRIEGNLKLKIKDAKIRQLYKDIFTRYAYTRLNTGVEDFPIYEKDKVDKQAVISQDPNGWKNFILDRFYIDAAYKHKVDPGEYQGEIKFVVTKNGAIKDFKKIGNSPKGINEVMLRLMTRSGPWIPAKLNGENVSSYVTVKITIPVRKLNIEESEDDESAYLHYREYKDVNLNIDDYENKNAGKRAVLPVVIK